MGHAEQDAARSACEQGWRDCDRQLRTDVIQWRRDGGGFHQPMPPDLFRRLPPSAASWFAPDRTGHGPDPLRVSGAFLRLLDHEITARIALGLR